MPTQLTTATGRIVWGVPHVKQPVMDDKTGKQVINEKTGLPVWEYAYGLALAKADFGNVWAGMVTEAMKVCNGVQPPYDPNAKDSFAYKFIDGDSMAPANIQKGIPAKPYSDREGYAGCYVLAIKSRLDNPPPIFEWGGNQWVQADPNNIAGGNKLKCGDYIQTGLSINGHAGQSPGLYLNPEGVQFVGFGKEIMRGPDATAMFGAGPAALPAGASATPVAPSGLPGLPTPPTAPVAPGMPGAPAPLAPAAPGVVPPTAPVAVTPPNMPGMPTASPTSPVAPVPGFAAGMPGIPAAPAAPAAPPAPPAPPARVPVGVDASGRPYYMGANGQTEY